MGSLGAEAEELLGFRGGFFNKALQDARKKRGLFQPQVAERVSAILGRPISSAIVSQYETLRAFPPPDVQEAIATVLGRPAQELFPAWLTELRQERAFKELPLVSLSALTRGAVKALQAFNPEMVVDVEEVVESSPAELTDAIDKALSSLSNREKRVLELRFGLHGERKHTLEEIGRGFGVKGERIRQIESKALRKLRHPSRSRHIAEALTLDVEPLSAWHQFEIMLAQRQDYLFNSWFLNQAEDLIAQMPPLARGKARAMLKEASERFTKSRQP